MKLVLIISCLILLFVGCGWAFYYWQAGAMVLFAFLAAIALLSLPVLALTLSNRLRLATIVISHGLLVILTLLALGDAHRDGVARSVHMEFLPVAAGTFLIFRRGNPYLRLVFPLLCLGLFLFFATAQNPPILEALTAPTAARAAGLWVNNITCVLGLVIILVAMQSDISARHALETEMRKAIAHGDYTLHYQPQVDSNGHVFGAEALLRWYHPRRGHISPSEFVPLAEETGLVIPIGTWVLRTACAQIARWAKDPRMAHLVLSVNVSASQFRQPDFVQQVKDILSLSGAPPHALKLELTESALADDIDEVARKMRDLRHLGITWSLDDFGTGYSSLSVLKRLPLDQLKIDQSFVRDLLTGTHDQAIVETLISLGRTLDLNLIAEGVETQEQMLRLQQAGCTNYQGYLFSKPLPLTAFIAYITVPASLSPREQTPPRMSGTAQAQRNS